jgi:hypothetical protein
MYVTLREDFFKAIALGQWTNSKIVSQGSLWLIVHFSEQDLANYSFSKCLLT